MISKLRFPGAAKSAITVTAVVAFVWWITMPMLGRRRPSLGGLAMEAFLTFGTMCFSVVAIVCALVFLVRHTPLWLAAIYSWIALGVVACNASLLALGYWQSAAKDPTDHYAFAGAVVVLSIMALVPAVIAQSVHSFRRLT